MYSKFDLKIDENFYGVDFNKYLEKGKMIYEKHEEQAKKSLKAFIYDKEKIDGTLMKSEWFKIENVDIFISHSHQDIDQVKAFAGWLYEKFSLTAFIDSCAWGYCNDLLKQIDDRYCKRDNKELYDYDRRNYSTSHVHMMLSTALTEMIDKTECIMFYNTPNSVSLQEELETIKEDRGKVTRSPWIYHELAMTTLVRRSISKRQKMLLENTYYEKRGISIEYIIDEYLREMITIESDNLRQWEEKYANLVQRVGGGHMSNLREYQSVFPLDILYQLYQPPK